MELTHLASFIAVAEELHFSRAAARINLSQPGLSKQIQQLETALDLSLFVRDRRVVRLTPEGRALLPRARAAVAAADEVRAVAARLRRGEVGRIRIGFTPSAPHDVLPGLLRRFRRRYPAVESELVEASSREQLIALQAGQIDVGILRPPRVRPGSLRWHDLSREPFVAAIPKHHALARRRSIALRHLAEVPLVLVAREASPDVYDYLVDACRAAGVVPRVLREASQVHATLALVGAGVGVSLLPQSASRLRPREVVFRPLAAPLVSVFVLAHAHTPVSPVVAAFVDVGQGALDD